MAILTLRLDDEMMASIRALAAKERRSLNAQVLVMLEKVLSGERRDPEESATPR